MNTPSSPSTKVSMHKALKISGFVLLVILTLSITINDKPLFSYIYGVISPATRMAQAGTETFGRAVIAATQEFSRKLFENSVPKMKDSVKSGLAAPKKEVQEPQEKVKEKERARLDDLIKTYN